MQTEKQVKEAFEKDLKIFLKKWNCTIGADDHYNGYAECGQDIRMIAYIPSIYDNKKNECIREYTEIDLGDTIRGN
jgi:hypothetical protein